MSKSLSNTVGCLFIGTVLTTVLGAGACNEKINERIVPETSLLPPERPSAAILRAVHAQLPAFLQRIPQGYEARYGFDNRQQFTQVRLAAPLPLYSLQASSEPRALAQWKVPLSIDGEWRVLATVAKVPEGYRLVALGGTALAQDIQEAVGAKSTQRQALMRLFDKRCDLLAPLDENAAPDLTHLKVLSSAAKALPYARGQIINSAQAVR